MITITVIVCVCATAEGNGGRTERYVWTQTLADVTVNVPLPAGTKSKMLTVDMRNGSLKVIHRS